MILYAFTAPTSNYPPYINATVKGDKVVLIVRGSSQDGECGPSASIEMDRAHFREFLTEALMKLEKQ